MVGLLAHIVVVDRNGKLSLHRQLPFVLQRSQAMLRDSGFQPRIVWAILLGVLSVPMWAQTPDAQTPSDDACNQGPDRHTEPIIFQARVQPATAMQPATPEQSSAPERAPKRNELPYKVFYSVPLDAVTQETVNGKTQVTVGAAVLSFNQYGRATGQVAKKMTLTLRADRPKNATQLDFDQDVNLPKGDDYL
jgi:hypothetical protein